MVVIVPPACSDQAMNGPPPPPAPDATLLPEMKSTVGEKHMNLSFKSHLQFSFFLSDQVNHTLQLSLKASVITATRQTGMHAPLMHVQ